MLAGLLLVLVAAAPDPGFGQSRQSSATGQFERVRAVPVGAAKLPSSRGPR